MNKTATNELGPVPGNEFQTLKGKSIKLTAKIASGGEGEIFDTNTGVAAKIYFQNNLRTTTINKLKTMLKRNISIPGICWPTDLLLNKFKEPIGYIMPKAQGKTLQHSVFSKPLLLTHFPEWDKKDLVVLALSCLRSIKKLHDNGILLGDINPLNFLVETPKKVWLVDTDSYQIENFCCPVGTINFTPPEIQGLDFKTFLRTIDHELFAVATLVFMILMPGKPPYAHCGGGTPGENIAKMEFSYPFGKKSNQKAPEGPWRFIWSNLPFKMKEMFYSAFKENKRIPIDELGQILYLYQKELSKGYHNNELFPAHCKIINPVSVTCDICKKKTQTERKHMLELESKGLNFLCPGCLQMIKFKKQQKKQDPQSKYRESYRHKTHRHPTYVPARKTKPKSTNSAFNLFSFIADLFS